MLHFNGKNIVCCMIDRYIRRSKVGKPFNRNRNVLSLGELTIATNILKTENDSTFLLAMKVKKLR